MEGTSGGGAAVTGAAGNGAAAMPTATGPTGTGEGTVASPAVPAVPPAPPQRFKVKVDGAETDVDIDELLRGYGHSRAANKRMEEAAKMRRDADAFMRAIRENPHAVIERTLSPEQRRAWVEKQLEEMIRQEEMSPEQRARSQIEQDRAKLVEERRAWERQRHEAEVVRSAVVERQRFEAAFTEGLTKHGLDVDHENMARMAQLAMTAIDAGQAPDAERIAAAIKAEHAGRDGKRRETKLARVKALTEADVMKFLEEEYGADHETLLTIIRKADLARVQSKKPDTTEPHTAERDPNGRFATNKKQFSTEDLRDEIDRRHWGGG